MKTELSIQDVYNALKMTLNDVGVPENDAMEYLENNYFIKKLFDNLEKIQDNKENVVVRQQ